MLGHQFSQSSAGAGSSARLGNFKDIEQLLRSDALDVIIADFTVHSFQRQLPEINIQRRRSEL
jgi:hypothetical protein